MRAPANPPASWLGRLALSFVALMLATTLAGASAVADEPADHAADAVAASELGAAGADGAADAAFAGEGADGVPAAAPDDAHDVAQGAIVAGQLSMELPLANAVDDDGQAGSGEPQTLAGYLAAGELRVSADVALAAEGEDVEPVIGSFTVDGLTYAVTGEEEAALVAVSPRTLAGSLAEGSAGDPASALSGEGIGSGVPPRSEAEQVLSGATLPQLSAEGTSCDRAEGEAFASFEAAGAGDAGEPAALAIPATVEHDRVAYAVTAIGPRALAGCDADAVIIPATVELVDESAFQGSAVASVEVAEGNPHISSYDGMLFDADMKCLLLIPEGKQGAARIPKTAEVVDPSSFSHSAGVDSIDVEAGSAAFSSRNGCLYDALGQVLLWAPDRHGVALVEAEPSVGLVARENPHATFTVDGNGGKVRGVDHGQPSFSWTTSHWSNNWSIGQLADGVYVGWQVSGNRLVYPPHGPDMTYVEAGERAGYTQAGWCRQAGTKDGEPVFAALKDGDGYLVWGDVVYAAWEANAYAVEYYTNDGKTLLARDTSFKYDEDHKLAGINTDYVTAGYEATGWADEPGQKDCLYEFGSTQKNLVESGTYKLYAAEKPRTFALRFTLSPGAGFGHAVVLYATYGGELPDIVTKDPIWKGHTFEGFYTIKDDPYDPSKKRWDKQYYGKNGTKVATKWDQPNAGELYARYEPKKYRVQYHLTGGAGFNHNQFLDVFYNKDMPENGDKPPVKNGYLFDGFWTIDLPSYTPGRSIGWKVQYYDSEGKPTRKCDWDAEPGGTLTLYARWKYSVSLDRNDGDADEPEQLDAYCDTDLTLPEPGPRAGFSFKGWNTKKDGTGTTYESGSHEAPNITGGTYWHEVTLYAQWTPIIDVDVPLEVSFDLFVDFESQTVGPVPNSSAGDVYRIGEFVSRSSKEVQVIAVEQEDASRAACRRSALRWFAQGSEAKAMNLAKVRVGFSLDSDESPTASASLAKLYGDSLTSDLGDELAGSSLDLSDLSFVIAAGSSESPASLKMRYALECEGLPLEDVAIDSERDGLLRLVYTVELVG